MISLYCFLFLPFLSYTLKGNFSLYWTIFPRYSITSLFVETISTLSPDDTLETVPSPKKNPIKYPKSQSSFMLVFPILTLFTMFLLNGAKHLSIGNRIFFLKASVGLTGISNAKFLLKPIRLWSLVTITLLPCFVLITITFLGALCLISALIGFTSGFKVAGEIAIV